MSGTQQQLGLLASRFRGCLVAGLVGDCLGAPFEGEFPVARSVLTNYFNKLMVESQRALQIFSYTDDTAMTRSVAESLVKCNKFDAQDMAKRFTTEYYRQPKRGYGGHVVDVFEALKLTDFEEPFEPAKAQFNGGGSYGNGAAMRVAPVALFGAALAEDKVLGLARDQALLTHAHRNGYNGAILECLAIREALRVGVQPSFKFDPDSYLNQLIEKMENIEKETPREEPTEAVQKQPRELRASLLSKSKDDEVSQTPFTDKLRTVQKVLKSNAQGSHLTPEEAAVLFGNDVTALRSVPTAIYSVIRAHVPVDGLESENLFLRNLYFSISVGGDTDTIASMASSIIGALYGVEVIPDIIQRHCEDTPKVVILADQLNALQP